MKPKTMIALIAALAACVVFVVLRVGFRGLGGRAARQVEGIFRPAPRGAKELTIVSADGSHLAFAKADGAWRMTAPVAAKADAVKMDALAEALTSTQAVPLEGPDAPEDAVTGLDHPAWTITLTDQRGGTYRVAVGKAALMSGGERTYVRDEASRRAFVSSFDFTEALDRPANDFRDKALWDVRQASIRRLTIRGRESYELAQTEGGWEVVTRQFHAPADADRVRLLLDRLVYLTVSDFVADGAEHLAAWGLESPRLTVAMELAAEPNATSAPAGARRGAPATSSAPATQPAKTLTLALGAASDDKVYAKLTDSPTVFELPASLLEDLQPKPAELRDRRVLPAAGLSVRGVDIELPEGKTVLVESDGRWRMERPFAGPANDTEVQALIEHLQSLQAERFEDDAATPAPFGLDRPRGTITLHPTEGTSSTRLLIGGQSPSGDRTFLRAEGSDSVAVVRTTEVEPLVQSAAAYWGTQLLEIPADRKATAIVLRREGETYALTAGQSGEWTLTKPVAGPADSAAVNNLLAAMRDLSARKIVALGRRVPDAYAKAPGAITVRLTTLAQSTATGPAAGPSKAEEQTLVIHAVKLPDSAPRSATQSPSGVYAWVEGHEPAAVGQMEPTFFDTLTAEFRRRDVGMPQTGQVQAIRITIDKAALALGRRLGQWRCQADPHVGISDAKVDAFLQNARLAKAQKFVAHRRPRKGFGLDKPHLVVEITPADGPPYTLTVSADGPDGSTDRYAACTAVDGVFLLPAQAIAGLSKKLEDLKD